MGCPDKWNQRLERSPGGLILTHTHFSETGGGVLRGAFWRLVSTETQKTSTPASFWVLRSANSNWSRPQFDRRKASWMVLRECRFRNWGFGLKNQKKSRTLLVGGRAKMPFDLLHTSSKPKGAWIFVRALPDPGVDIGSSFSRKINIYGSRLR